VESGPSLITPTINYLYHKELGDIQESFAYLALAESRGKDGERRLWLNENSYFGIAAIETEPPEDPDKRLRCREIHFDCHSRPHPFFFPACHT
jgi:hypothetical protein